MSSEILPHKKFWLGMSLVLIVAGGLWLSGLPQHTPAAKPSTTQKGSAATKDAGTIRLLAAGDFLAHDTVNAVAKQADGSYDYLPIMSEFPKIFQAADIRFCNDAQLNGGADYGISGWPKFNSPPEFATDMGKVGCNVVNTGTNHSFDRTQAAINATQDTWAKVPNMLAVAGQNRSMAEHDAVHYFTVKGVKFAFLAYTTYLNQDAPAQNDYGVNVFSQAFAASQIKAARAGGAQIIIASMRWGTEYAATVNDTQKSDAQWLADQGVDIVLGHGSHVLQPVQQLTGSGGNTTTVWYSLGDFMGTQLPADTLFNALGVMTISTKTKRVISMSYLPIYMHYEWTPAQAQRQNNDDLLARHNLKMYFLDQTTQPMIDAQQLNTTVAEQKQRLQSTLNQYVAVSPISEQQYLAQ